MTDWRCRNGHRSGTTIAGGAGEYTGLPAIERQTLPVGDHFKPDNVGIDQPTEQSASNCPHWVRGLDRQMCQCLNISSQTYHLRLFRSTPCCGSGDNMGRSRRNTIGCSMQSLMKTVLPHAKAHRRWCSLCYGKRSSPCCASQVNQPSLKPAPNLAPILSRPVPSQEFH